MLRLKDISKKYQTGGLVQIALDKVSLNFRDNEFVAILGPSGSGKSTLLNIVGGLDRYDKGDLIINGVSTKRYKDRDWDSYRNHSIGFVFQSYNLIAHQTILANVELALTISGVSREERRRRAREALTKVGLGNQIHKKPSQLSGGQMQRVAIARALVNDPAILLADEPTGALDSETSEAVMELLKEVAKDRLVVMVTHNPELAEEYATRIVRLKDGRIVDDSGPLVIKAGRVVNGRGAEKSNARAAEIEDEKELKAHNFGKASMSWWTALMLSFNNLKTKFSRTLMVSFAGSIGIIGIALILALSNGVNKYIQDTERETMSEYPVTLMRNGITLASMTGMMGEDDEASEGEVKELLTVKNMLSAITANDLAGLRDYMKEYPEIKDYARAIEYEYNLEPTVYAKSGGKNVKVNPNDAFESLGLSSNSAMSGMFGMSINSYAKLPKEKSLYQDNYDLMYGKWPESKDECVILTGKDGGISDFIFYSLGLRDMSELKTAISQFSANKEINFNQEKRNWKYQDLMGADLTMVSNSLFYEYDASSSVYISKAGDAQKVNEIIERSGTKLKVVGVAKPNKDMSLMTMGIYYTDELAEEMRKEAAESEVVKTQLASPNKNVLTGEDFGAASSDFSFQDMISIDSNMMRNAFSVDTSKIALNANLLSGIDYSKYMSEMSDIAFSPEELGLTAENLADIKVNVDEEKVEELVSGVMSGFMEYLGDAGITLDDIAQMIESGNFDALSEKMGEYLGKEEVQSEIGEKLKEAVDVESLSKEIEEKIKAAGAVVSAKMAEKMAEVYTKVSNEIAGRVKTMMMGAMASLPQALKIDTEKILNAFTLKMGPDELRELMVAMAKNGAATLSDNLATFGYADDDDLSEIAIFAKDFDTKAKITSYLNDYNAARVKEGKSEIVYSDTVGLILSSVTTIVDVISYVLIAFVSISLVVSSIMIGVITYISVLERRKEIGVLRALGASKRNISQVFNAETIIIGLSAGLLGVIIAWLITIPANMILRSVTGIESLTAYLSLPQMIILVLISVTLTLIGGLIPAKGAAKSDPVAALREE